MRTIYGEVHFCMNPFPWSPINVCPCPRGGQVSQGAAAWCQGGIAGGCSHHHTGKKQPTSILKPVCYPPGTWGLFVRLLSFRHLV